jgi:hypothetical protein
MSRDCVIENLKPDFHPHIDHARALNPQQLGAVTAPPETKLFSSLDQTLKLNVLLTAATALALTAPAQGSTNLVSQTTIPAKAAPSVGLLNDWLRRQSPEFEAWDIGGQFRLRFADSESAVPAAGTMTGIPTGGKPLTTPVNPNTDFIANGKPNSSDELLLRERVHLGCTPASWLTAFAEFQSATENRDQRSPSPDQDEANLRQASLSLGDPKNFPLTAKVGRQELIYGDQRFAGVGDWNNPGRTFDAVKLRYAGDAFWVDAFSGNVVVPCNGHFDNSNSHDWFSGIYASSDKLLPWQESQVYFLSRNADANAVSAEAADVPGTPTTARDIYTFGFRFKSLPGKLGGWDYSLEAAGQLGGIYNSTLKTRLDQQAYAVFACAGYTWKNVWAAPRLGIGFEGGSGDSNSNDGKSGTFDNLFGSNHSFYGQMDLFCERNMNIPRISASATPLKNLTLTADYLWFYLASTRDLLYPVSGSGRNSNGYGIHPGFSSEAGSELDLTASYALKPWCKLQAGYGHFFVGDYIKESAATVAANGGASDADWVFVQTTISF